MDRNITSIFNSNIIKWYPFDKKKTIIQIGKNEEITAELNKKFKIVEVCDDIQELKYEKKYEYILIYGYENFNEIILEIASKILDENGKVLIIANNFFGINNWSKYNVHKSSGVLELENTHKKIVRIEEIKEELKRNDLRDINTFYSFPDYQQAELIINEKFNINQSQIEKYNPIIEDDEIKVFDEIKILRNIVKYNPKMLNFFANSYFIEASRKKIETNIRYISYNNCRNEEYQLITILEDDIVKKIPTNEKAKKHIEEMGEIINEIKEDGIEILDYDEKGIICSKLVKNQMTLDNLFAKKYNDLDFIVDILNKMKNQLIEKTISYDKCKDYIYLQEKEELLKDLHFMRNCYWDMIAKNCFYINNKFFYFDQEWKKNYLPLEFIIYRSVINSYDLVRKIKVDELLNKLNIIKYKKYFENIDKNLRKEIINGKIYEEMYCKEIKKIDNLINDNNENNKLIKEISEDNNKKQIYIQNLEEANSNLKKENNNLEEINKVYSEKLNSKKFFWKR